MLAVILDIILVRIRKRLEGRSQTDQKPQISISIPFYRRGEAVYCGNFLGSVLKGGNAHI